MINLQAWGITPEILVIIIAVLKAVVILLVPVLIAAVLPWLERRLLALWQDRYGPNRVGPFGLGQVVADMLKIFFKEDWTPPFVDKFTFWLAPGIGMGALLLVFAIIPITPGWQVVDMNVGLLFFFAIAGLAVYAAMLGGWSSNSKYSLIGGVRTTAQTVSYEVFMGLSLMGIVAITGSFNLRDIVLAQQHMWFVIPQFLGFFTFAIAGVAVAHRSPFDLPEAEQELAAGFHTEYSGMKFGMFFVGEYVGVLLVSILISTLFFGGWLSPFGQFMDWPIFWISLKTFIFVCLFILVRGALPRPRYDQIMDFGWKVCLPLTLINLMGTGAVVLWLSNATLMP